MAGGTLHPASWVRTPHSTFLGKAFRASIPLTWVFAMTASRGMDFPSYPRIPFYVGMGLCLLLCAVRSARLPTDTRLRQVDVASGVVLCTVPLAMCAWEQTPTLLICLYMPLGGIALGWMSLRWFQACCSAATLNDARNLVLASFAVSASIRLVLTIVSSVWPTASLILTAALAAFCIAVPSGELGAVPPPRPLPRKPGTRRVSIPYVCELALCSAILGGTRNFLAEPHTQDAILVANYLLRIVVPLILLAFFSLHDHHRSYRPAQYAIVVLLFALLVLSVFGEQTLGQAIARALLLFTWDFTLLLVYLMALGAVFDGQVRPFAALGLYRGVLELFLGIGMLCTLLVDAVGDIAVIPKNIVLFLVGTIFLFAANRFVIMLSQTGRKEEPAAVAPTVETACRSIGESHGLTERELEIMTLICKGFSKGFIAEELGLSENTVRWHSKNLYEKLGIHSKQELLKMVEDGAPAEVGR